jgi:hypothetical protein
MNGVSKTLLGMTVLLVPALGLAQQNQTQPFSYSYVELGYDESDFDLGGGEIDGDGLTLSASWALTDDWHVYGSYATADLDFGIDLDSLAIGAGYRYPLQDDVDLYGRVLYINSEVDVQGPADPDDDGLGLQFRIRGRVNDQLELEGGIQYVDVGDSDTSLQAGARYYFTNEFSAGVGLTFGGDTDGIGINARYSF